MGKHKYDYIMGLLWYHSMAFVAWNWRFVGDGDVIIASICITCVFRSKMTQYILLTRVVYTSVFHRRRLDSTQCFFAYICVYIYMNIYYYIWQLSVKSYTSIGHKYVPCFVKGRENIPHVKRCRKLCLSNLLPNAIWTTTEDNYDLGAIPASRKIPMWTTI